MEKLQDCKIIYDEKLRIKLKSVKGILRKQNEKEILLQRMKRIDRGRYFARKRKGPRPIERMDLGRSDEILSNQSIKIPNILLAYYDSKTTRSLIKNYAQQGGYQIQKFLIHNKYFPISIYHLEK